MTPSTHEYGNHGSEYTELQIRSAVVPGFVRHIGERAGSMSFADAVTETFEDASIAVHVDNDVSLSAESGLLIAGDHRKRIEPLLAQAVAGDSGRDASHVVAMPLSYAGRLIQATGEPGSDLIIPVIPGGFAAENPMTIRTPRNLVRRQLYPHVMKLPRTDVDAVNDAAMTRAAEVAEQSGVVTIFPSGGNADADGKPWRNGLGRLISLLPEEARATTEVAVMRTDDFSLRKMATALVLREAGMKPTPQEIVVRLHSVGTVDSVVAAATELQDENPVTPRQITDTVQKLYDQQFGR